MARKTWENITIKIPERLYKNAKRFGININTVSEKWVVYLIKEKIAEKKYDDFSYLNKLNIPGKLLRIRLRDGRELEISFDKPSKPCNISFTATYHRKSAGNAALRKQPQLFSKHAEELGYMTQKDFRNRGLCYFLIYLTAKAAKKRGITIIAASMVSEAGPSKTGKVSEHLFKRCGGVKVGEFKKVIFDAITNKYSDLVYMQADTAKVIKETGRLWRSKGIKIVNGYKMKNI